MIGCRHATSGDVTLHYRAPPRVVTASTRTGPLFDLRDEAGGVQGAGWTFLAVPVNTEPYRIQLHWDLSDMPAGSRGIWSLGEGDVSVVAPAERLVSTFYFAGPVHSYPPQPTGNFAMYWRSYCQGHRQAAGHENSPCECGKLGHLHTGGQPGFRLSVGAQQASERRGLQDIDTLNVSVPAGTARCASACRRRR